MYKQSLTLCFSLLAFVANAEDVHVGVVYPSLAPINEIARLFEKSSSDKIIVHQDNFSSLTLYQQIKDKDDVDMVLFGDVKTSIQLENDDLAIKDSRFTYAFGKLVLWGKNPNLVDAKGEVLATGNFRNFASLDPKVGPYGSGVQEVLTKLGLKEKLKSKWIFISNSGEMRKQVMEGTLDMAFLPLATLNPSKKIEGSLWIIPKTYYTPIEQQAVLLKRAENNAAAKSFFNYLKSPHARNIFEKYGYTSPQ
ncbi:MAG: molybdate ABC transporter substrate-binding protein [Thiotrichaceae bacterium]|nr:molybdate ABC transporter substrate-binding protein [Thiotrichaceae bacterium]